MMYKFVAIPIITKGNLFPDKIILNVSNKTVVYQKRAPYIIGYQSISISFDRIASVSIHYNEELLYFSNIQIETFGGKIVKASGFRPKDAKQIKYLIESY